MITSKFYVWLKAAIIRAIRTIAQTTLATIRTGSTSTPATLDYTTTYTY